MISIILLLYGECWGGPEWRGYGVLFVGFLPFKTLPPKDWDREEERDRLCPKKVSLLLLLGTSSNNGFEELRERVKMFDALFSKSWLYFNFKTLFFRRTIFGLHSNLLPKLKDLFGIYNSTFSGCTGAVNCHFWMYGCWKWT